MRYWDEKDNAVVKKSKAFALRMIRCYHYLISEKHEFVISKQMVRSGTSIGANVREAHRGQSALDFYTKMDIALKEADETAYWLELLYEGEILEKKLFDSIYQDCEELIRIIVSILKHKYKK